MVNSGKGNSPDGYGRKQNVKFIYTTFPRKMFAIFKKVYDINIFKENLLKPSF